MWRTRSKNKYNARKTICLSKHRHDSCLEANYCNRLLACKQAGEIQDYHCQVPFEVGPEIVHRVDFLVLENNDKLTVRECKGIKTAAWIIKRKLFCKKYTEIKYVVVEKNIKT